MLLTLDVGNTNTVLGVFRREELIANWRLTTARTGVTRATRAQQEAAARSHHYRMIPARRIAATMVTPRPDPGRRPR